MEVKGKEEDHVERRDEFEEDLNINGIRKGRQ
jgi:hypothetical protein